MPSTCDSSFSNGGLIRPATQSGNSELRRTAFATRPGHASLLAMLLENCTYRPRQGEDFRAEAWTATLQERIGVPLQLVMTLQIGLLCAPLSRQLPMPSAATVCCSVSPPCKTRHYLHCLTLCSGCRAASHGRLTNSCASAIPCIFRGLCRGTADRQHEGCLTLIWYVLDSGSSAPAPSMISFTKSSVICLTSSSESCGPAPFSAPVAEHASSGRRLGLCARRVGRTV